MPRNYFTLYHAARELHEQLAGTHLSDIHSPEKNNIALCFTTENNHTLQVMVYTRSPAFSLSTEKRPPCRRNTARLMTEVYGTQVDSVSISPGDREILVSLDDSSLIILRFFSTKTNVLLVRNGHIVSTFRKHETLAGMEEKEEYQAHEDGNGIFKTLEHLVKRPELFQQRLEATPAEEPPDRRLCSALPGFDRRLAREVITRAGGSDRAEALHLALIGVFYELSLPSPCVREHWKKAPELSLLELVAPSPALPPPPASNLAETHATHFDTVLDALNHYTRAMHRFMHLDQSGAALRKEIEKKIVKAEKELDRTGTGTQEWPAERYETLGHLLITSIGMERDSPESMKVANLFESGTPELTIPLKPELSLQQNAARYFSLAAKARNRVVARQERDARLRAELQGLRAMLDDMETAATPEELKTVLKRQAAIIRPGLAAQPGSSRGGTQGNPPGRPPKRGAGQEKKSFRSIPLSEGMTLFIGKNAENNDLLTFGHAAPNDIWLHARGASGSHCVLKGAGLQHTGAIQRAAEIAAWYSSARHSSLVPVICTQKKFVRRAKNSKPGSVIVEREKVIMVRPAKESQPEHHTR